tara:strand:+ start:7504 stop:7701 length:198 start_codon:yes stop_codon:yes gene_type:complete
MLDTIAQRYGTLPSKLLCDADSFDIMVFDVAVSWEKLQHDKQNKKVDHSMYDQDELQAIMDKVRK